MIFVIDNALSPVMAEMLRSAGHDALHVRDVSMQSASDEEIFNAFHTCQHVIVSADTDFGTLLAHKQKVEPSVILFRRTSGRSPEKQVDLLLQYLPIIEADLKKGSIVVFEEKRIRIRSLPIG